MWWFQHVIYVISDSAFTYIIKYLPVNIIGHLRRRLVERFQNNSTAHLDGKVDAVPPKCHPRFQTMI